LKNKWNEMKSRIHISNKCFVDTTSISTNSINRIKRKATLQQKVLFITRDGGKRYDHNSSSSVDVECFQEDLTKNLLILPRFFFEQQQQQQNTTSDLISNKWEIQIENENEKEKEKEKEDKKCYKLFEFQQRAIEAIIGHYHNKTGTGTGAGAVLVAPCGSGKTDMAIEIIKLLRQKCLILVHKEDLLLQWQERIEKKNNNFRIGKIQKNICDVEGKQIVLAMIQTLFSRVYSKEILETFGLIVVDEAHHISAPVFNTVVPLFKANFVLGLTATPHRSDGLTELMYWTLGPKIHEVKRREEKQQIIPSSSSSSSLLIHTYVNIVNFQHINSQFDQQQQQQINPFIWAKMISSIAFNKNRNQLIIKYIKDLLNFNRNIIVLSHRVKHLKLLQQLLTLTTTSTISGLYIGQIKSADERKTQCNKQVIFATYQMAEEGLDLPRLDTLIFATPKGNKIEQPIGRIQRLDHNKANPLIIDIRDMNFAFIISQLGFARMSYYKKRNFSIVSH